MGKKTFEKKKQRERDVKKKLAVLRSAKQLKDKEERIKAKVDREAQKAANKIEGKTFKRMKEEDVVNQLEHNLEILEALQQEQERLLEEQKNAPMLNQQGIPLPQEEGGKLTASADVVFTPNPEVPSE